MLEFYQNLLADLSRTSLAEWCAASLAIAYLLLAVKENIGCWYAAFASTLIYSVIFFDIKLYMESVLNGYYLLMAIYGWRQWRGAPSQKIKQVEKPPSNAALKQSMEKNNTAGKPIVCWSRQTHCIIITSTSVIALLNGYLLATFTDASLPYIDSLTTWFAVVTTVMVAKKELQNWLYWIVIDSISVVIYWYKGIPLTALIFIGYVVIAIFGWYKWRQHYQQQCATGDQSYVGYAPA